MGFRRSDRTTMYQQKAEDRRGALLALGAVALLAIALLRPMASAQTQQPPPRDRIQALIVTGVDLHNWRATAPVLAQQLHRDPRIEVHTVEDPHFLDSAAIQRYDVIVLHFMDWQVPAPGEAARANLKQFVENGKGLVLVHFACGAWQDWPEFRDLAGRVWDPKLRGHDSRGPFRVDIVNTDHPITKGLDSFETDDELYTCLAGDRPVDVLATARSKVDGKDHLMAFCFDCGRGRVFHCVLGHDVKALSPAPVGELFRRGTAWAAGRAPVADRP
ncbi:MAG: ThuA domain-containing protein [Armatimonadota bacterium]